MTIKTKLTALLAALLLTTFTAVGCSDKKPTGDVNVPSDIELENKTDEELENEEENKENVDNEENKTENEPNGENETKEDNKKEDTQKPVDNKTDKEEPAKKDEPKKDEPTVKPGPEEQPEVPEIPAQGTGLPEELPEEKPIAPAPEEPKNEIVLPEKPKNDDAGSDTVDLSNQTVSDIINMIYENKSVDLYLDTLNVDVTDANSVKFYTGLADGTGLKEIAVSEPMMGSQAYSLVLVRVAPGTDAASIAKSMKSGINPAKWICVEADHVVAASSGDLALLFMVQTDLVNTASTTDILDAFKAVCGTITEQ